MNVSIVIATYGQEHWRDLVLSRAYPSAKNQGAHEIVVGHDPEGTLASVRNSLAEKSTGDWLCFLDADDELGPGYLQAMTQMFEREWIGLPLLLTPAVSYVVKGRGRPGHFSDEIPLREGNWLCIGTLIPKSLFLRIGGFRQWPLFEDWDLWARTDARVIKVPDALYLARYSRSSRNRTARTPQRNYWHQMIGHDLWPDYYDAPSEAEHAARGVAGVRKLKSA